MNVHGALCSLTFTLYTKIVVHFWREQDFFCVVYLVGIKYATCFVKSASKTHICLHRRILGVNLVSWRFRRVRMNCVFVMGRQRYLTKNFAYQYATSVGIYA
jgi:hypothetical protein